LEKEKLLQKEEEKRHLFFYANRENNVFVHIQRNYFLIKFKEIGLLDYLEQKFINPVVILFGSSAKAEIGKNSDIDLAIFTLSEKGELNIEKFEKKLKRNIQFFIFKKKESVKNKNLLNNILNGFILSGSW
jgi:predicted nucleotidyltransferase